MDEKTIIQMLLNKMLEEGLWFTTKNDPTYEEASSYYELDQYGDLTDKAQSKIVKERTLREVNNKVEVIYSSGGKLLNIKGGDDYGNSK